MLKTFSFLLLSIGSGCVLSQDLTQFVNPFIGTSNYGATHPGAAYPHAMVSISPFNVAFKKDAENPHEKDSEWNSRTYIKENAFLTGFSHVNLSGVGCPDLGSIITMPTTGDLIFDPELHGTTYADEIASPGYYSVYLEKSRVKAEFTSTLRTGLNRFTFPKGKSNVLINLGLGLTNETGASLRVVSPSEIEGHKLIGTFCYNPEDVRPVYFVAQFSKPSDTFGAWKKMPAYQGVEANWVRYNDAFKPYPRYQHVMSGENIGAYFAFNTEENETIEVKIGVSYISIENARQNLLAEQSEFDFDGVRERSVNKWNELLSRIKVEGGSKTDKIIFYTALYHILTHPNIIQDVNGDYPLMGSHMVGNTGGKNRYTVFSLWDTYRNVHPFLSLVYPELQSEMVNTMVDMYDENGWLPKWELLGMETNVMVGDPATPVIADTYLRGIRDFDIETAYEAIVKASTTPGKENALRPGIDPYNRLGFIPEDTVDKWGGSVSTSLEYYIADWNIATLSKELGNADAYKQFLKKSKGYTNYYDKSTGMLRPRFEDGTWYEPFDPEYGKNFEAVVGYVEGNAWQYRFYVPHDIPGLIKLIGGKRKFIEQLQMCFDTDNYSVNNEPDITYPFLFNYVKGEEWRSQKTVRNIVDEYYTNTPEGIPGNDDTGTLSAWLVFSMMGIYPVCPGDMDYAIVTPRFDKLTIKLNQKYYPGEELIITTRKNGNDPWRIKEIKFQDRVQERYFINHKELIQGGVLEFELFDN